MVLNDIVVVCLFMFDGMLNDILVHGICCLYYLLKIFPNCQCVCHSNNNVRTPFQQFCGGSNHGSPVFIRFGYPVANSPTHSLKSRSFPVDCNGQTMLFELTQCSLHYKLGGVTS